MKKLIVLLLLTIGLVSCGNISFGNQIIEVKDLIVTPNYEYKYRYTIYFDSSEDRYCWETNENYEVGDTLKYTKQYIIVDTLK